MTSFISRSNDVGRSSAEPDAPTIEHHLENVETAWRESEARLNTVGDVAPVGLFIRNVDGSFRYGNPEFLSILGIGAPSGKDWLRGVHPDDRRRVHREWQKAKDADVAFRSRHRLVRADGSVIIVETVVKTCWDGDRRLGFIGAVQDLTTRLQAEQEREALIERLQMMLDRMPIGCILTDTKFRFTYCNPAAEAMFGYRLEEMVGKHPVGLIAPIEAHEDIDAVLKNLKEGKEACDAVGPNLTKDGRTIICSWSNSPLRNSDGDFIGIIAMCQDITARVEAEEALRHSEATHRQIVATAQEGVWVVDAERRTSFVNNRLCEMLGYSEDELIGHLAIDFIDPNDRQATIETFEKRKLGIAAQFDLRLTRKDGTTLWVIISASPMYDASGAFSGSLSMVTDITDRKLQEEVVRWHAYHDPLTGLPNRVLFEDRLGQMLAYAKRQGSRVAVLFLDLDRFKHVNDTLGHGAGDRLLKVVAGRLQANLRTEDTVARMGGDEFTILLPGVDLPDNAGRVAQKLLDVLAQPIVVDRHELFVSGSIGITIFPDDGQDTDALLKYADVAMYRVKATGGNGYQLFAQTMNTATLEHLILENSLRKAITRNEFLLVYQPQVDAVTGRTVSFESLCRWNHPDLGMIRPDRFIPLAEETGAILPLGDWIIEEACRQAAEWSAAGSPLRVSVNISARQLACPKLAETIATALAHHCLPPQQLDLEITESSIMSSAETASNTLDDLRHLGVRLSLDDFGTGYSSLSYLRRFPFDGIKIDRSFTAKIVEDKTNRAVVQAMVDLAAALELDIICEGVETEEQRAILRDMGCRTLQGFLFSRPLLAESVVFG